ncbi:MAG: YegS/Rv2252/BmrU family lipid kinase [Clostridiales bacterium]|nr:YegS/Rv2252/BmrU family lipid kinase [Clostridiales bacterium]
MKKLLLILNPRAGMRRANKLMPEILSIFWDAGYQCTAYVTGASGDATRILEELKEDFDLVVCIGGDGTLNETVAGMRHSGRKCPVGYIPAGTTNDYANSLGLSPNVLQAAVDIVNGKPRMFDAGRFNDIYFTYTATCGAFARTSYTTPQAAKNAFGHLAYVIEGVRDLGSIKPMKMRIETENRCLEEEFVFCSITNSTSVGGILKLDAQLVALNDGRFEVTLVKNPTNPSQLSRILYGLTTQDIPNEMIYFFSTPSITITCDQPVEWTLDGERAPELERVELINLHNAIELILPERPAGQLPILPEMEPEEDQEEESDEDQLSD